MDTLILEGILRRLAADLTGRSLLRVARGGTLEYHLRFATPAADRLVIRLRPPHPCLHRAAHREAARAVPPDPFAALLERTLEGARLERIHRPGLDRVVEMDWETLAGERRTLVAELIEPP